MTDNQGACEMCIKVCHGGHEIEEKKYAAAFCDCGPKGSPSCKCVFIDPGNPPYFQFSSTNPNFVDVVNQARVAEIKSRARTFVVLISKRLTDPNGNFKQQQAKI